MIVAGVQSATRALSDIFTPTQQQAQRTVDTSNIDEFDNLDNGLAVALYRPLEAAGTVVPAAASALVPASEHASALATTNITGGGTHTSAMIPVDTPAGTSNTDDSLFSTFAVTLHRPSNPMAPTAVSAATVVRTTSAHYVFYTTSVTGGDDDARTIATIGMKTAGTAIPVVGPYGNLLLVLHRPISSMAMIVPPATAIPTTFAYCTLSTTSVTGRDDGARTIVIIGRTTTGTDTNHGLVLVLYHPVVAVTAVAPSANAFAVRGMLDHVSPPASTATGFNAPTGRPSPPESKATLQARQRKLSAPVVEVSGTCCPYKALGSVHVLQS